MIYYRVELRTVHQQLNQSECQIYILGRMTLLNEQSSPHCGKNLVSFFLAALRTQNTQQRLHSGHCNNWKNNTNQNALKFF